MTYKPFGLALALLFLLNSCGQQGSTTAIEHKDTTTNKTAKPIQTDVQQADKNTGSEFDINKIPLSAKEPGNFPYLTAPKGYEYKLGTERDYEEKFYYYNDSLVIRTAGRYFYSRITKKEDNTAEYGKTFVLKNYEDAIKNLGGVQLYTGTLSDQARELLEKEKPEFFKDLSTNFAISYKQYVLRTEKANIWFELASIDNEYEIRLSVIKQDVIKQDVTKP